MSVTAGESVAAAVPGSATTGSPEISGLTRAILGEIGRKGDLPAVAKFVKEVLAATSAPSTPTNRIVDLVLKDLSLTNSILRLVNSAYYRRGSDRSISTISRAVLLLGVDAVANIALGLNVFEHFAGRADLPDVKRLMIRSLLTGIHTSELTHARQHGQPEESFVCGLLHDLGRLAITFYTPEKRASIDRLMERGRTEEAAWQEIVGTPPSVFGTEVAKTWRLPEAVCTVIAACEQSGGGVPATAVGAVTAFGRALADASMIGDASARTAAIKAAQTRFADAVPITARQLDRVLATSAERVRDLSTAFNISKADLERAAPSLIIVEPVVPVDEEAAAAQALAVAEERHRVFMHFMEEIALALTRRCPLNDLFLMILEGMHRGVGCNQVVLTLLTPERDKLRARYALGDGASDILSGLQIPLDRSAGALAEVVTENREVCMTAAEAQARSVAPDFRRLIPAATFMMLPIAIGSPAIGAFLVARQASDGPFTPTEQRSLRTLVNYAVLAVRQARGG